MPAAAVIPAPIAYIKVVAVKKLVVGFRAGTYWAGLVFFLFFLFGGQTSDGRSLVKDLTFCFPVNGPVQ